MGHKYFEPICGEWAFACEYFRAEPQVNAGPSIDILDLVEWTGRAWVAAAEADIRGIAQDYELPIEGLSRDELIDLLADRRGAREVA
jgi:hypothetical protein